jgi:polysaccharide export outer membrane protein
MARAMIAAAVTIAALVWATIAVGQGGNYQIQPGDRLNVEVLEDTQLNRTVLVTPDGRFSFPLVDPVRAAGRTTAQIERALASQLEPSFANRPTVFVSVTSLAPDQQAEAEADETLTVYVLGEVNNPGPKGVLPNTTVLQLLSQAGGFTPFAATKRLQLRRTYPETGRERLFTIDYRAISRGARIKAMPVLQEGDVLLVPERRLFE